MASQRTAPDLGIVLARSWQEFVRTMHADLATRGFDDLGRNDGYVFRTLAERPLTVSALASRLEVTKQGAGQIVDDMERRGYVVRRPDPDDARARLIDLSARGRAAMAAARAFHQRTERRLIRQHGAGALATVRTVLQALGGDLPEGQEPQLRAMSL
jgi:DNA-binding MarR family transcriptional regulator